MEKRTQAGFTLYELLITVVIVGVVLSFGIPNLREFTQNSRMTGAANDLHAAFQMARGEAARAKTNITICASANAEDSDANCGGTWDDGFIVFVDEDANRARAGENEAVLRAHSKVADGITMAFADNASYFMFASTGLGRTDTAGDPFVSQVVLCDERGNVTAAGGNSAARLFVATPLGRATILRDRDRISAALAAMGKSCP
jgi:type IV fimbrial biogenesis protein FimT